MAALKRFLQRRTAGDVLRAEGADGGRLVEIDAGEPLGRALSFLVAEGLLSAPVFDPALGEYRGFLDIRDAVAWTVLVFRESTPSTDALDVFGAVPKFYKHMTAPLSVSCLPSAKLVACK